MAKRSISKEELWKHYRTIIDEIGICDSVKSNYPEYFIEFCEILQKHSNSSKIYGLIDVKIAYNPKYPRSLVVYIIKENGDEDDVSIKDCIYGKKMNDKDKLNIAMRVAIQPQIDEYRKNITVYKCDLCSDYENIEIDHHSEKMPFVKLCCDFMKINTLSIPNTFDNTIGHQKCFRYIDHIFEEQWVRFHRENAILRMLCRRCNGSQPKYKHKN